MISRFNLATICTLLLLFIFSTGCKRKPEVTIDIARPKPILGEYFDKKYLVYKLPNDYYKSSKLNQSFSDQSNSSVTEFRPLGYDPSFNLQYTHVYSKQCVYHVDSNTWKYAEVCFPNTCITKDNAYARVHLKNTGSESKTYYSRLFYQNTTYWYPTNDSINLTAADYLDNYYGASGVISVSLKPQQDTILSIPYTVGLDPKHEFSIDPDKDPARPGNYEFMLLTLPGKEDVLLDDNINLQKINPFAEVKKDQLQNGGKKYTNSISYTAPHHFKFVFLDEYFDGKNDLDPNHVYKT